MRRELKRAAYKVRSVGGLENGTTAAILILKLNFRQYPAIHTNYSL